MCKSREWRETDKHHLFFGPNIKSHQSQTRRPEENKWPRIIFEIIREHEHYDALFQIKIDNQKKSGIKKSMTQYTCSKHAKVSAIFSGNLDH